MCSPFSLHISTASHFISITGIDFPKILFWWMMHSFRKLYLLAWNFNPKNHIAKRRKQFSNRHLWLMLKPWKSVVHLKPAFSATAKSAPRAFPYPLDLICSTSLACFHNCSPAGLEPAMPARFCFGVILFTYTSTVAPSLSGYALPPQATNQISSTSIGNLHLRSKAVRLFRHQLHDPWFLHVLEANFGRRYGFRCSLPLAIAFSCPKMQLPVFVLSGPFLDCLLADNLLGPSSFSVNSPKL